MALTKVTYSMINGPVANVVDFGADPTGVADSYAAIKAAYDSNAAIIQLPAGTFKMSQTLVLGRGVTFQGSGAQDGSGGNGQSSGVASTVINYTGTGNAIEVGASYTEQVSNVHVSNLMITGNSGASGGLFIGTLTGANKCTFKNLGIFGFTNTGTNLGYGVGIRNCIESLFENVYVHGCHDGFNLGFGACTSLQFNSCFSRVNSRYGWLIRQGNGMSWYQSMAEGNHKNGILIEPNNGQYVGQLSFYSWYSEANQQDATGPVVGVHQAGTGNVYDVYFYSPVFYDNSTYTPGAWTIAPIEIAILGSGTVSNVRFINAEITSVDSNFISTSGDVTGEWNGRSANVDPTKVTGNSYNALTGYWKIQTNNNIAPYNIANSWTPAIVSGATATQQGGIYSKNGSVVTFQCNVNLTAVTGNITISGLPYTEYITNVNYPVIFWSGTIPGVTINSVKVVSGNIVVSVTGTYSGGAISLTMNGSYFAA